MSELKCPKCHFTLTLHNNYNNNYTLLCENSDCYPEVVSGTGRTEAAAYKYIIDKFGRIPIQQDYAAKQDFGDIWQHFGKGSPKKQHYSHLEEQLSEAFEERDKKIQAV